MVQLQVKGTKFPDVFLYNCLITESVAEVTKRVTHLQNMRHKVRLQLHSMGDLVTSVHTAHDDKRPAFAAEYEAMYTSTLAEHKNATFVIEDFTRFDDHWLRIKQLTTEAFPKECSHKDGEAAAVTQLWELHENPDLDEDYRLHVYHCRAILDPQWRENEVYSDETKTVLWFCGKVLDKKKTIGDHCSNNAKSKLTVKVGPEGGAAPSGEPRMSYDDQRSMRNHVCEKRAVLKTLEDSELRDVVLRQSRGQMLVGVPGVGGGVDGSNIRVQGVSKGLGSKGTETEVGTAAAEETTSFTA